MSVSDVCRELLPTMAEIWTVVFWGTASVTMEKLAVVAPGATATGPTGVANELLLPSTTVMPPEGAGPPRVTVPDALLPP